MAFLFPALILIIVLALLGVLIYKVYKGDMKEPDYYNFFIMGIIWLPFGIAMLLMSDNSLGTLFSILGGAYIAIGLKHKDKWHKPRKKLTPERQKFRYILIAGVFTLLIGVFILFLFV
jgi:archaellum biogenesis protein FlaJ (TadC family)